MAENVGLRLSSEVQCSHGRQSPWIVEFEGRERRGKEGKRRTVEGRRETRGREGVKEGKRGRERKS